jgi:hypothetical protein
VGRFRNAQTPIDRLFLVLVVLLTVLAGAATLRSPIREGLT